MIRILYSDLEIDIRADRTGFAEIRTGIEEVVSGRVATWRVSTQSTDPLPYDVCLAGLAELSSVINCFCVLPSFSFLLPRILDTLWTSQTVFCKH